MAAVGIRRVFWTNHNGEWEGGKVRDMVAALEGSNQTGEISGKGKEKQVYDGGPLMYATKHEVLMMRRIMGGI